MNNVPILARYLFSNAALDFPTSFFAILEGVSRPFTGAGVVGLAGFGGTSLGRNVGVVEGGRFEEANECKKRTAACFLDRTGFKE